MRHNILVAEEDKDNLREIMNTIDSQTNIDFYICNKKIDEIIFKIAEYKIDLVFIDTDLISPHVVSCIDTLRNKFNELKIVLISDSLKYLDIAFDIVSVGFILKPVNSESVFKCIKRAFKYNDIIYLNKMRIHYDGKDKFINFDDIVYIEASNRKCIIHTIENEYSIYGSIKSIITEVPTNFFKSHRSYLINVSKIEYIEPFNKTSYNVVFFGNKFALAAKNRIKLLKAKLTHFSMQKQLEKVKG